MTKTHSWTIPLHVGIDKTLIGITKTHRGMIETFLGTIPPGDKEVEAVISEGDSRQNILITP